MNVTITRTETSNQGTFGILVADGGFTCYTGELEWLDNEKGLSCIPAGEYPCVWHQSPSKGWVYWVQGTDPREDILIHVANFCGSVPEYRTDLLGCIGLGQNIGTLSNQRALLQSRPAVLDFNEVMQQQPFTLTIKWADGVGENA